MTRPIVHLYCLCWNEETIIPFFLRHYEFVSQFFIFDNNSTDGSLDLLRAHGRVTVTPFEVLGDSFVLEEQRLSESIWHSSRGVADWVAVLDMDEFLYHPNIESYFQRCSTEGINAIRTVGFDMVADSLPCDGEQLVEVVTNGSRSLGYDKLGWFKPSAITATNFSLGRHGAFPTGYIVWPQHPEVMLLHYKHLGPGYSRRRNRMLGTGLGLRDIEMGWARHYLRSDKEVDDDFARLRKAAQPVPGLKGGPPADMLAWEEAMIRNSGRFDQAWYLAEYPDVAGACVDPVAHYHIYGWREGRKPNPHFDPDVYLQAKSAARPEQDNTNPFLPYFSSV